LGGLFPPAQVRPKGVIQEESFELILTAKEAAMRSKAELHSEAAEKTVRNIRRATRR
jgi:hypothetical protein